MDGETISVIDRRLIIKGCAGGVMPVLSSSSGHPVFTVGSGGYLRLENVVLEQKGSTPIKDGTKSYEYCNGAAVHVVSVANSATTAQLELVNCHVSCPEVNTGSTQGECAGTYGIFVDGPKSELRCSQTHIVNIGRSGSAPAIGIMVANDSKAIVADSHFQNCVGGGLHAQCNSQTQQFFVVGCEFTKCVTGSTHWTSNIGAAGAGGWEGFVCYHNCKFNDDITLYGGGTRVVEAKNAKDRLHRMMMENACWNGGQPLSIHCTELIGVLLCCGVDPNWIYPPGLEDSTFLHNACASGSATAVKVLLAAGASVGAISPRGKTPLMRARERKCDQWELVVELLEAEIGRLDSAPAAILVTGGGLGPTNGIYVRRNKNTVHGNHNTFKGPASPIWYKDDQTYMISLEQEATDIQLSGGVCYAGHHRYWFSADTSPKEGWNCDDEGRKSAYHSLISAGHKYFTPSTVVRKTRLHPPAPTLYTLVNPPKASRTCTSEWDTNSAGDFGGQAHEFQIDDKLKQMTIDLGSQYQVIGFAMQARAYWRRFGDQRVTKYTLETSVDGQQFIGVDGGRVFGGPPSVGGRVRACGYDDYDVTEDTQDKDTVVHVLFHASVTTQYVRLQVQEYEAAPSFRCAALIVSGQAAEEAKAKEAEKLMQQWQVPSSAIVNVEILSHEGSFGDVHLVQYREVDMAFKTIRTGGSKVVQTQVKAALKEAYALKEAQHENVIRLEGICIDDPQRMGILMEYAAKGTLRQVLDNTPTMTKQARYLLIRGILRGLAKLHSHAPTPILHGDLKAANVLVSADGTPKVADFGLASGASSGMTTTTHRGGGTLIYSAPELFADIFEDSDDSDAGTSSDEYTMACDLYSAGVLLGEVDSGQQPWHQSTNEWAQKGCSIRIIERKLAKEVYKKGHRPTLSTDCPPLLLSIIERLWHQDPQQRPSIQLVLDELEADIDRETLEFAAAANMADDYALPDVPGYTLQRFHSSNFKREYEWTATKPLEASQTGRLLEAVRRVIESYCAHHKLDQVRGDNFFLKLREEWQLTDGIGIAAERLWTSAQTLDTGTGRHVEFCFVFSELLRKDPASLARSCAIIARALNMNLIAGRTESVAYPQNGECWRGGGFDEQHRTFFTPGKKYRVPGFLASSLRKSVSQEFLFRAEAADYPVVQWCIKLNQRADPQGENSLLHRCKHVNLLRVTHCKGEMEYLFAAYSVFTVCDEPGNPYWSDKPTTQDPHRITIEAAVDNSHEEENLPLAPWS
jgi:serine/threonine protein kinase